LALLVGSVLACVGATVTVVLGEAAGAVAGTDSAAVGVGVTEVVGVAEPVGVAAPPPAGAVSLHPAKAVTATTTAPHTTAVLTLVCLMAADPAGSGRPAQRDTPGCGRRAPRRRAV
jgi:hypothetical protein